VNAYALSHNPYADPLPVDLLNGLPYADGRFDLVFTSGLLIHMPPHEIALACAEIARVSSMWVAGYEYHAYLPTPIRWRGREGLLWKANYPDFYKRSAGLSLARSWLLAHIDGSGNADCGFLLKK
jgi:hypothetical protein